MDLGGFFSSLHAARAFRAESCRVEHGNMVQSPISLIGRWVKKWENGKNMATVRVRLSIQRNPGRVPCFSLDFYHGLRTVCTLTSLWGFDS